MTSKGGGGSPAAYADEAALAAGLAAMEADAWRHLFDAQYGAMYRYAYLRVGNQHDAEDIAASVFVEAVKSIGKFNYRGVPVARWLYGIAHHQTVDALQSRKVAAPLDDGMADGRASMVEVAALTDLSAGLAALKEEHREVLLLRFIEDKSVRETANCAEKDGRRCEGAASAGAARAAAAVARCRRCQLTCDLQTTRWTRLKRRASWPARGNRSRQRNGMGRRSGVS